MCACSIRIQVEDTNRAEPDSAEGEDNSSKHFQLVQTVDIGQDACSENIQVKECIKVNLTVKKKRLIVGNTVNADIFVEDYIYNSCGQGSPRK